MPDTVQDLIRAAAAKYGVPVELALAVAEQESGFNPTLVNPKKVKTAAGEEQAVGTFQFLPSTAKGLGFDPNDPRQNIDGGAKYLRQLMDQHEGDLDAVLRSYGGVKDDTSYVPGVLARLSKFKTVAESPKRTVPATGIQGAAAEQLTREDLPEDVRRELAGIATDQTGGGDVIVQNVKDIIGGARAGIARTMYGGGDLIRRALGQERVINRPEVQAAMTPPESLPGQAAYGAETLAEYIVPSGLAKRAVLKGLSALPNATPAMLRVATSALGLGAGEAASTYGVSKLQGVEHPGMAAAFSGGVAGAFGAGSALAPAMRRSAAKTMERLLNTVAEGNEASDVAVKKILPIALDDEMLRLTHGRWARAVKAKAGSIGQEIGAQVGGPIGDEIVPTAPLVNGLDKLEQKAVNYVPVNSQGQPIGATAAKRGGPYALRAVAFNDRLVGLIQKAKEVIQAHGPDIPLRQMINLRRDWDDFVFASKKFLNRDDIVKQYEARTKLAATDAIRDIIHKDPRFIKLDDLDNRYHLTKQLYTLIADESLGQTGIRLFPGWGLENQVGRRLFNAALNSPSWRLMSVAMKNRLASAVATNNQAVMRRILAPVVGASAAHIINSPDTLLGPDVTPPTPPQ